MAKISGQRRGFSCARWVVSLAVFVSAPATTLAQGVTVTCSSDGGRVHCDADTSAGILMTQQLSVAACLLGKSWGYDDQGVWVTDGCSAEFLVARAPVSAVEAEPTPPSEAPPAPPGETPEEPAETPEAPAAPAKSRFPRLTTEDERSSWGAIDASGQGVILYSSKRGQLSLAGYGLVRYIDQQPAEQSFKDHLGFEHAIDTRRDVQFHRAQLHFKGWAYSPKLRFQITSWTVMSTDQSTLYGFIGYQAHKKFNIYGGINTLGGSRSVFGSHPFWLANDRVMADEFFRGSFTGTLWANGEVLPGLWYHVALANNLSQLGITASQLSRDLGTGYGMWWMPTTHEFGPNGSYSDFEHHENLATRFGFSTIRSRENRQSLSNNTPENSQVKLADSLLLFNTGSLAPGVTVQEADWESASVDAGFKYRGIFVQAEVFRRWLDHFVADGPLPVAEIVDDGFYVQAAFFPIKRKLELYAATSWVYGDEDAGYDESYEYLGGMNFYPFDTRLYRVNAQVIDVTRSAVGSVFGFYVGGQTGTTYSIATSVSF